MSAEKIENIDKKLEIYPECHWCAYNVARIALWGNLGLFILKLLCSIEGESKALLADAVHSGTDFLMGALVWVSLRISKSPADEEHPFGHGHIEYIASLAIGISLTLLTGVIIYDCINAIVVGVPQAPDIIAFIALIVSIVANEVMFRHAYCCGTRFNSPAMLAYAWENRADVYSSIAALVGVTGAMMGFLFMDPLGGVLVAILIGKSAIEMIMTSWKGILDHSLDESIESRIHREISVHPEVLGVASFRARESGSYLTIDLKLAISPELTLREGCEICNRVREALIRAIDNVGMIEVNPTGFYGK